MKTHEIVGELRDKVLGALEKSSWFKELGAQDLSAVADLAVLASFEEGETILKVGEQSDSFYLLMKGSVSVEVAKEGGTAEMGRLKAPFTFGEIGLLLSKPRTATLIAAEQVLVLKISSEAFQKSFDTIPSFRLSVARSLASRLESVTEMVLPQSAPELPKP
jgi:CRP/FNR family cyclic AMP-dependent transcriptional regulator